MKHVMSIIFLLCFAVSAGANEFILPKKEKKTEPVNNAQTRCFDLCGDLQTRNKKLIADLQRLEKDVTSVMKGLTADEHQWQDYELRLRTCQRSMEKFQDDIMSQRLFVESLQPKNKKKKK